MDRRKVATVVAVTLTVLVGAASYSLRAKQSEHNYADVDFEALPLVIGPYAGRESYLDSATQQILKADTTVLRYYEDPGGVGVGLFVAYFGEQNYGQQIHSPQNCLPGSGWRIVKVERLKLDLPGSGSVPVSRLLIEAGGRGQVVYYLFLTRAGYVADEFRLKFRLAQAALTFKSRDGAMIRVTAPVIGSDIAEADARAVEFMRASWPYLVKSMHF